MMNDDDDTLTCTVFVEKLTRQVVIDWGCPEAQHRQVRVATALLRVCEQFCVWAVIRSVNVNDEFIHSFENTMVSL